MVAGKGETKSFDLFCGAFTTVCTLWQLSFVGDVDSSSFLGQSWTSAQLNQLKVQRFRLRTPAFGMIVEGC